MRPSGMSMPLMRLWALNGMTLASCGTPSAAYGTSDDTTVTMLLPSGVWSPDEANAARRFSSPSS